MFLEQQISILFLKIWSNDAENSDLHLRHKLHMTIYFFVIIYIYIYIIYKLYFTIEQYYCFYRIFDQVKNVKLLTFLQHCKPAALSFVVFNSATFKSEPYFISCIYLHTELLLVFYFLTSL